MQGSLTGGPVLVFSQPPDAHFCSKGPQHTHQGPGCAGAVAALELAGVEVAPSRQLLPSSESEESRAL